MLAQVLFQLVYYYISNRIDFLPNAYFFADIYYTEHSYIRLKFLSELVGSIFLKRERSFLWLIFHTPNSLPPPQTI